MVIVNVLPWVLFNLFVLIILAFDFYFFVTVMSCANEAPLGAEPIAINASAEIALAPLVYVGVTRTYSEPTDLAGGTIALEAYPNCSLEE